MFALRNVPIVIEPGVSTLEAEMAVEDPKFGRRLVPVHLHRVDADEKNGKDLPFIPTTRIPHIFSLSTDIKRTLTLVVYDSLGRIAAVHTREGGKSNWTRHDVAEEHAGKSVTQFSVRFVFGSSKDRLKFLTTMEKITEQAGQEIKPDMDEVMSALRILSRMRVAPVLLPVATEKCTMSKIKL
jgi:hypothetical protein